VRSRTASRRGRAPARPLAVAFFAAVALALLAPAGAGAHAVLTHTAPHQNSSVDQAPREVRLEFNEPVEASFGAVRVFDRDGSRVDSGDLSRPGGKRDSIAMGLDGGLGRGIYTATYRVVSADGHPVSGGFSFGVGVPVPAGGGRGAPDVAKLLERSDAGPFVEGSYGVVRGLHYAALLLVVGALFFRLFVCPPGGDARWPGRVLLIAAVVGLATAVAGIVLQGAVGAGVSLGGALDSTVVEGALSTRTGEAWLARAFAWLVVLAFVLLFPRRPSRVELLGLALPAAVLVGSLPYAGHADTQSPRAVLIPADVLHVLAAGAWLGGLVLLLVAFWPRRSATPDAGAATATARFSRLALPAIVVLVAAGALQAWFYLDSVGALFDSTYGLALLAKIALLAAVVGLAVGSRRRVARLAGRAGGTAQGLRRSMRAEILVALVVLAATATLVRAAPPAAEASGPVVRELDVGPLRLQMDIEPAKVGPNALHLYFFDRRTGAQVDRVKQVTVRLNQPEKKIGPIKLRIPRKGPAHYELLGQALGVPGKWEAEIDVRISRFDQHTAETTFELR
jgi:copper transport protein